MGDISKNISKHELKCKCGDVNCNVYVLSNEPVIHVVQDACDHFAKENGVDRVSLVITSAGRCYIYNRLAVEDGGAGSNDNSQHPRARAIDFKIFLPCGRPIDPKDVYKYLDKKYPTSLGLGSYVTFTHADGRPHKARW